MAKTFKPLPVPATEPAKPISERDFFDLTDETVAEPASKPRGNSSPPLDNRGNKKTEELGINTSNTSKTSNTDSSVAVLPVSESPQAEERDQRQTFVVSSTQLEQLRDFVHARRAQGNYEYSQKQALREALALLFASGPQVAPRPSQTRELEQRRSERIRRGKAR